jgi:phage terminase large subunit-like protein
MAWIDDLAGMGEGARDVLEAMIASLSPEERAALLFNWDFWARGKQRMPPGNWRICMWVAGRGFGKTKCMTEALREVVEGGCTGEIALIGRTEDEAREKLVEHKKSGVLAVSPPWFRPKWYPGLGKIEWPNGAVARIYTTEEPDALRGQEFDLALWDEYASARPENAEKVLYNLRMALRASDRARVLMSSTWRRNRRWIREMLRDAREGRDRIVVVEGDTTENANISATWRADMERKYRGTRLAYELGGAGSDEDDEADTLFKESVIGRFRVSSKDAPKRYAACAVCVDPAISTRRGSDESGIVGGGRATDGHAYVTHDESGKHGPDAWVARAVAVYDALAKQCPEGECTMILERNRGGDLVAKALRDWLTVNNRPGSVKYLEVNSQQSKGERADPVAAKYERGVVHHVGELAELEAEMEDWRPLESGDSPNRVDALCWAVWHLTGGDAREMSSAVLPGVPSRLEPFFGGEPRGETSASDVGAGFGGDGGGRFV